MLKTARRLHAVVEALEELLFLKLSRCVVDFHRVHESVPSYPLTTVVCVVHVRITASTVPVRLEVDNCR